MELRVSKPFDAARMLADLRLIYADRLRAARAFASAAVVVGVAGAALLLIFAGMNGLVVILLILAALGLYSRANAERGLSRAVAEMPEICLRDAVITVTDERIVQEQPSFRVDIPWTAIIRVLETDTGWLLFYGPRTALSLPRAGLPADGVSETQFQTFLNSRTPVAADVAPGVPRPARPVDM